MKDRKHWAFLAEKHGVKLTTLNAKKKSVHLKRLAKALGIDISFYVSKVIRMKSLKEYISRNEIFTAKDLQGLMLEWYDEEKQLV